MKFHGTLRRLMSTLFAGIGSKTSQLAAITALGAIFFTGCGGGGGTYSPLVQGGNTPAPDFTISVGQASSKLVTSARSSSPSRSITVAQGVTAHFTVTVTALYGFSAPVTLSLSGVPAGATTAFGTTTVTPTATGVTTTVDVITAAAGSQTPTPAGTYTITLTGTAGTISHMTTDTLIVTAPPDFTIALTPATATVVQNGTANYTVTLTSIGGFDTSTVVLALPTGLPFNTAAKYGTPVVTSTGSTVPLSIKTSTDSRTPLGTSAISLVGTAGALSHSVSGTLAVSGYTITVTEATPGSGTIFTPPSSVPARFIVTVTSVNGYNQPVNLETLNLPAGAAAVLGSPTITPTAAGATTTLSISPANPTNPGSYTFTVYGNGISDGSGAQGSATMVLIVG